MAKKKPAKPKAKPAHNQQYTDEQIAAALEAHHGILAAAAQSLSCSRTTIYNRMKIVESVKDARENARETMLDIAEGELFDMITKKEVDGVKLSATIFYLKTQGKGRGYVERQEIDQKNQHQFTGGVDERRDQYAAVFDRWANRYGNNGKGNE